MTLVPLLFDVAMCDAGRSKRSVPPSCLIIPINSLVTENTPQVLATLLFFILHWNQRGGIGKTNSHFHQNMAASVRYHNSTHVAVIPFYILSLHVPFYDSNEREALA